MKNIVEIRTRITSGLVEMTLESGDRFFAKTSGFVSCDAQGNLCHSTVESERRMHVGEFNFSHANKTHHLLRGKEIEETISSLEKHATKI